MIKTAIIIERADITLGGAERSVFELAAQLSQFDVKVTILAAKGRNNGRNVQLLCNDHPGRRTSLAAFAQAVKTHCTQNHYDIIHSTLPFDFADVYQPRGGSYPEAVAQNAASYKNTTVRIYKKLTHLANLRRSALLTAERNLAADGRTTIAAISNYVKDQFKRHYATPDHRIVVIPNGVKVCKQPDRPASDSLRTQIFHRLGITAADNPAIFLFAANNFRLKGLRQAIMAMGILTKRQTPRPAYLVVAGSGSSRAYRLLARSIHANKNIVFLGRLRNIQDALSISDAALLPTWYDPCSRFILEALSAAKPVITTAFNGAAEAFTNDRHGKIIDRPDNIEALADAMTFYADPANARNAANAIVEDNLKTTVSIVRHAKQIADLYTSILNPQKKQKNTTPRPLLHGAEGHRRTVKI